MFVLHAGYVEGELRLWGEVPAATGRPRAGSRPSALPHDAGKERLLAALQTVAPHIASGAGGTEERWLWAPASRRGVVPSTPLVGRADPAGKVDLRPFRVTTIAPAIGALVPLLAPIRAGVLAPGIGAAADLAFFAQAVRIAGALVARQRMIPDAQAAPGGTRASWRPVPSMSEIQTIAGMVRAMPGAARALTPGPVRPPAEAPAPMVMRFVGQVVDALVRGAASRLAALRTHGIHERWLAALGASDGRIAGEEHELARLCGAVVQWQRPVLTGAAAPLRLCLRIEEPQVDDAAWRVAYLLQAADDPSLLVPAADVWRGTGKRAVRRGDVAPREILLASLGQAARLSGGIARSLERKAPEGYPLDAAGAFRFLGEEAPLLREAGFGVLLPSWWTGAATKARLSIRARARGTSTGPRTGAGLTLEDVFSVDWELALGGAPISPEELQRLGRCKAPLVRVRGQWVHVGQAEIQAALAHLARGRTELRMRDLVGAALGATPAALEGVSLPIDGVSAGGQLAVVLDVLQGRASFAELAPPPSLRATLRPYQRRGFSWLAFLGDLGLGACLADDMGLGKTVQALALLLDRRERSRDRRPALVVCPTSVVSNWAREAERFAPGLHVMVHHGAGRTRGAVLAGAAREAALVISSYQLLWRDAAQLGEVEWSALILDEAQNVKNPATQAAQAARTIRAGARIAMTGTPVENHVGELWSIMEIVNPGLLGPREQFRRRFGKPIHAGSSEAAERLRRLTSPFILRRLKTDRRIIDDLPEKMEMKVYCTLTREQATLYAAVAADALAQIEESEGMARRGLILASLARLKQLCNHPLQLLKDGSPVAGRSGKLVRLCELLDEAVALGDRSLVFTQFAEMGEILAPHLQERLQREVAFLHGGISARARTEMVARFQEEGGPSVLVLTLKAGGTGLNLTAASHVFHYDRWWNPAVEEQATDRAFRIGQTRRVQVRKLVCAGTLEEKIDAMIERKRGIASQVVGSGEASLTELSTEELRDLLSLEVEAVGD